MEAQNVSKGSKGLNAAIGASAAVALLGIGLWAYQFSAGLVVTNMGNTSSWGMYIICFMFLVGLSAGGLIISSAPRVFGLKGFGGISKIAVWTSIVCTVLAMAFVVIDLGGPLRAWELVVFANLSSPLMWDIIVLTSYLLVSILYLRATLRFEQGKSSARSLRILSGFALVIAVLVHSVTAWIFGLQRSHELWNTALLAPWFVSSALVCGLALVLLVVLALRKMGYLELAQENVIGMVKLLGVFVVVDLYFFGCELLTAGFPGGESARMVEILVAGPLAPFFWIEVLGCVFAAVVAFVDKLRTNGLVAVAAALAIVGIFCKRVQLLVGGFQVHSLELVGPISGPVRDGFMLDLVYAPSLIELGIALGVFALGVFGILMGIKYLPLAPAAKADAAVEDSPTAA